MKGRREARMEDGKEETWQGEKEGRGELGKERSKERETNLLSKKKGSITLTQT